MKKKYIGLLEEISADHNREKWRIWENWFVTWEVLWVCLIWINAFGGGNYYMNEWNKFRWPIILMVVINIDF